ncbi:uncharacterized protein LOC135382960 [Ornithodoros turicata]|uniref:uncharacterized protein LOC135382960 n=1 Tax=Ornithodoros turicata TaxID=34597 RepID=UPI003139D9E0
MSENAKRNLLAEGSDMSSKKLPSVQTDASVTVAAQNRPQELRAHEEYALVREEDNTATDFCDESIEEQAQDSPTDKSCGDTFNEISVLKRQLHLERKKRAKAETECSNLKQSLSQLLMDDQLHALEKGTMRGSAWSPRTIQESLKVRLACGARGYDYLRDKGWPLPADRTLQKHIEDIKFTPGILEDMFPALEAKVATFEPEDCFAVLLLDEIQLAPGLDYDCTTHSVTGRPTIPPSDPTTEPILATHALVFMLAGVKTRWKQTVAYHFTGKYHFLYCP